MRELGTLREGWDTLEADEIHLLRRLTVHESIRQWLILQRTLEPNCRKLQPYLDWNGRQPWLSFRPGCAVW